MAKKKHIKLTDEQKQAIANAKLDAGARRKAAVKAGEYDGRFRPRRERDRSKYNRTAAKKEWKE